MQSLSWQGSLSLQIAGTRRQLKQLYVARLADRLDAWERREVWRSDLRVAMATIRRQDYAARQRAEQLEAELARYSA